MTEAGDRNAPATGVRMEAAAGEWTATMLSAVPAGAGLAVSVRPDGPVSLHLVHADAFTDLPETADALYSARITGATRFEVAARSAGDHALVLDNRAGRETRSAAFEISASAPGGLTPEAYGAGADAMLRAVSEGMARMLRFDPGLSATRCGRVAPFGEGGSVCLEFPMTVMARVEPRAAASGVVMLTIFARVAEGMAETAGRTLDAAERAGLAVAAMTVLGYAAPARAALEHLAAPGAADALRGELEDGADYIPEGRRAAALLAAGDGLVETWHDLLLASLSDDVLERMAEAPPAWTNAKAVAAARAA